MHPRIPHLRIVLGSLVLFACAPPAAATGPDTHAVEVDCARPAAATGPEILDIASAALGETRRVEVDLPASYAWATERRYPVLYLLDGQTHGGHAAASSEFLAAQGQLPELIVVSVHSTVRVRDFTQTDWPQAWVGGGGARHFTRFLEAELVPRIEREYRAAPFRILAGHSASGQYVLHQLATQPATFHAYLAMAPSLDWDGRLPIRELESALPRADRPARFAYFAYGDDLEQALADDLHLARALAAAAPGSLRAQVRAYPDETHSALPLLGVIDGLRALYAGYALPEDLAARGLSAVDAHYAELSARLGTPVAAPRAALNEVGDQLLHSERVAEAIAVFERAARENPSSANAWHNLAEALDQGARPEDALQASRRAVELATRFDLPDRAGYERSLSKLQQKAESAATPRAD
jgi:predicted alpha/beta superfamily hydrolase